MCYDFSFFVIYIKTVCYKIELDNKKTFINSIITLDILKKLFILTKDII